MGASTIVHGTNLTVALHTWNRRFYLAPLRVLWSGTVVAPQKGSFGHPLLGLFGKNP